VGKPNTQFNLSVRDIDIIESALRTQLDTKIDQNDEQAVKEIRDVLGRIHNQKNWYRPTKKPYISG
jgi:predicted RNA-binding protein associated with RNAse of E/G family